MLFSTNTSVNFRNSLRPVIVVWFIFEIRQLFMLLFSQNRYIALLSMLSSSTLGKDKGDFLFYIFINPQFLFFHYDKQRVTSEGPLLLRQLKGSNTSFIMNVALQSELK